MKSLARLLFAVYLVVLAWLILFKFSVHVDSWLHYDKRSLNFEPFSNASGSPWQSVANVVIFIPFGLLLSVNYKRMDFWRRLIIVLGASMAAETIQYVFGIGVTDITDVITNTLGGLIGVIGYDLSRKHIDQQILDKVIVVSGSLLLGVCLLFLAAVEVLHGVRYHSPGHQVG